MIGATIYILRCSDGSYYTGIRRRSAEERVSEHALGLHESYTFTR
jgi:putative endonuclease